jgi:TetR/AcrR family transcriptional repressor of mexJK operon
MLSKFRSIQTASINPVAGLSAFAGTFIDLVYTDEALQLYRLIIAEQRQLLDLGERITAPAPNRCCGKWPLISPN